MRSAEEVRQRWLDVLPLMITRAGMYTAGGGGGFDTQMHTFLDDLCFLDGREDDRDGVTKVLRGYGKLGVVGPFVALFGKDGYYVDEVAFVWAAADPSQALKPPRGNPRRPAGT